MLKNFEGQGHIKLNINKYLQKRGLRSNALIVDLILISLLIKCSVEFRISTRIVLNSDGRFWFFLDTLLYMGCRVKQKKIEKEWLKL